MILVVSLNLSIDRTISVGNFAVGEVHRATKTEFQVGGKGVNVARTLKVLEEPYELIGLIGGLTGDDIESRLEHEGISHSLVRTTAESRTNYIILSRNGQTVINENGVSVEQESIADLVARFSDRIAHCDAVVLTGSVQPGVAPAIYQQLIRIANDAGKLTLLDATGACLLEGLAASPTIAKPNHHEASSALQQTIDNVSGGLNAARKMLRMGAKTSAITMGKQGMVVASASEAYMLRPPAVDAVNAVGSGDATAAGFAAGLRRGLSLSESARLAVACGTASVKHGFGRCSQAEIEEIQKKIETAIL